MNFFVFQSGPFARARSNTAVIDPAGNLIEVNAGVIPVEYINPSLNPDRQEDHVTTAAMGKDRNFLQP